MMTNSSFELGGCCLARHGAASYFPSKTEEILSRYRPIAPKPAGQSAGMADAAQPCSARSAGRSGARKRSWDAPGSSPPAGRAHKRPAGARAARCTVELSSGSKPSAGAETSEEAVSALCEISDSAASKNYYFPKFGYAIPAAARPPAAAISGGDFDSVATKTASPAALLEKDAAFMERAAASASPSVVPERPCNAEAEAPCAAEDLVTLPLLPDAPPFRRNSPSPSSSCVDRKSATLEQIYSASPDPLLLLADASHQVLWFNPAYERASAQGSSLGTPVPLSTFTLNGSVKARATLWGFLRKSSGHVIMPQPVRAVGSTVSIECILETNVQASSALRGSLEDVERELECESLPSLISDANNRVRWVNSAYKQMVGQPECPWLESTANNSSSSNNNNNNNNNNNSSSSSSSSGGGGNGRERMNGEVVLVTSNIKQKLPEEGSFSGRVKIQWTNGGAKTSLTAPSDVNVVRITPDFNQFIYAWKLDIHAALRLTC